MSLEALGTLLNPLNQPGQGLPAGQDILSVPLSVLFLYGIAKTLPLYLLAFYQGDMDTDKTQMQQNATNKNQTFDFIIVGAGAAGSLIAHRLADNYDVLLIEAGGELHPIMPVPTFFSSIQHQNQTDWMYESKKLKQAGLSLNAGKLLYHQGKVLGGTTSINAMVYYRGHPEIYSWWAKTLEDPKWNYENLIPFFKKHESFDDQDENHGQEGEIPIRYLDFGHLVKYFLKAGEDSGYRVGDMNGVTNEGFSKIPYTIKDGKRVQAYQGFINTPKRGKITIYKYTTVNKIMIRSKSKKAYGVLYERHGVKDIAKAKKEIIICAGVFNTPKLLTLSGIGTKEQLKKIKANTIMNLPVGQNLQDHVGTVIGPFIINRTDLAFFADKDINTQSFTDYNSGKGPLTSPGGGAVWNSLSEVGKKSGRTSPDTQMFILERAIFETFAEEFASLLNYDAKELKEFYAPSQGKPSFLAIVMTMQPKSKGSVTLRNSSPASKPIIDLNYLENKDDVSVLLEGINRTLDFFEKSTVFKKFKTKLANNKLPGCKKHKFRSDEYWECYVRHYTLTPYHACCTAPMGSASADSVLDSSLRVKGIQGLRVADSSAIPMIPNANVAGATYVIAEICVDSLIKEWPVVHKEKEGDGEDGEEDEKVEDQHND